jgi:hypothetical protein
MATDKGSATAKDQQEAQQQPEQTVQTHEPFSKIKTQAPNSRSNSVPFMDSSIAQQEVKSQRCTRRSDSGSRTSRAEGATVAQGPATASKKRLAEVRPRAP